MLSFVRVRRLWIGRGVRPLNLWSYTVDPAHKKKDNTRCSGPLVSFWTPTVGYTQMWSTVDHSSLDSSTVFINPANQLL